MGPINYFCAIYWIIPKVTAHPHRLEEILVIRYSTLEFYFRLVLRKNFQNNLNIFKVAQLESVNF